MGRINMTEKELIQFLKKNLTVEVRHPEHRNVGYYDDKHNLTIEIKLCGETICKDTSYS